MEAVKKDGANEKALGGLASGIALALTMFVEAVGYGMVAPTLPFMATRVGASERGIGLLVGLYAAVGLVAVVPLGALANRYGRRSLILFGLVCLTLASLGFVVAPNYSGLVAARLVQGLAASAIWVGALTIAGDLSPTDSMGQSLSWITGAWSLGFVVGPALGGLGEVHTPFVAYAALSSLALLAVLAGLKEAPRPRSRTTLRGIVGILRLPAVLTSAAATFTLSFYYGLVEAFLPLLISQAGAGRLAIGFSSRSPVFRASFSLEPWAGRPTASATSASSPSGSSSPRPSWPSSCPSSARPRHGWPSCSSGWSRCSSTFPPSRCSTVE
jgi:MFS family permease